MFVPKIAVFRCLALGTLAMIWGFLGSPLMARAEELQGTVRLGVGPLLVDTPLPALDQALLEQNWGLEKFKEILRRKASYFEPLPPDPQLPYFAIAKVQLLECFSVNIRHGDKSEALLARLVLVAMIYDQRRQAVVLRESFSGYAAQDKSQVGAAQSQEELFSLLGQRAFAHSVARYADKVAQRLPLLGSIQKVEGDRLITINLGTVHGVQQADQFEVLNKHVLGRVRVISRSQATFEVFCRQTRCSMLWLNSCNKISEKRE